MSNGDRIHVYVRCRPLNEKEKRAKEASIIDVSGSQVSVMGRNDETMKRFNFDGAFGISSTQHDVFSEVLEPTVEEVLAGFNCTVFAYGQTGTGKTFTMEGGLEGGAAWSADHAQSGMIPRAVNQIFKKLEHNIDIEYSVRVSHMELYNEDLIDLLAVEDPSKTMKPLKMLEHPTNGVSVHNLEELPVNSADAIFKILRKSNKRRTTAATKLNAKSSRSHCLFTITVHTKETTLDGEEVIRVGKLNLVDLAGSENVGRSQGNKREAGMINQSLLTLGRVITSLVQGRGHIPYRESKLTRLLAESLGGRAKTSIIATVAPSACNLEETLSTLGYANTAKNIQNKPQHNNTTTKKALIKDYTAEIERLKQRVLAAREKNGVYIPPEEHERMEADIAQSKEKLAELEAQLEMKTAQLDELTNMFSSTRVELQETTTQLQETHSTLEATKEQLSSTEASLEGTRKELQGTRAVVASRAATEEALYDNASKILSVLEEREEDVEGLHAKVERKVMVEGANMQITSDFKSYLTDRMATINAKVSTVATSHEDDLSELRLQLSDFMQQKASDIEAMCERMDALQSLMATQKDEFESMLQSQFAQQEATMQQMGKTEQLERARALESLSEYASSATAAIEQWREDMQTQSAAAAEWSELAMSHLEQTLQASEQWTGKHVNDLNALRNASEVDHDTNQEWATTHEEQLSSAQETLNTQSEAGKKELLSKIASIMGTFVADGNAELATTQSMLMESIDQQCVRVTQQGEENASTLLEHQESVLAQQTAVSEALAEVSDEVSVKVSGDVARIAADQDRSAAWTDQVSSMQRQHEAVAEDNKEAFEAHTSTLREASTTFQEAHGETADSLQKKAQEWNEDTQGFVLFVAESVQSMNYAVDADVTECKKSLDAWGNRMDADVAGISDRFGNFFYALKEDEPSGQTPVKHGMEVPRDLPISMPREQIVEAYWDRQLNGLPLEAQQEAREMLSNSNVSDVMQSPATMMTSPECTPVSASAMTPDVMEERSASLTPLANLSLAIENARLTLSGSKSPMVEEEEVVEEEPVQEEEHVEEEEPAAAAVESSSEEEEQPEEEEDEENMEPPTPKNLPNPGFRRGAPNVTLIKKLTVKDLKVYMKEEGLAITGKKADLVDRIVDHLTV